MLEVSVEFILIIMMFGFILGLITGVVLSRPVIR